MMPAATMTTMTNTTPIAVTQPKAPPPQPPQPAGPGGGGPAPGGGGVAVAPGGVPGGGPAADPVKMGLINNNNKQGRNCNAIAKKARRCGAEPEGRTGMS